MSLVDHIQAGVSLMATQTQLPVAEFEVRFLFEIPNLIWRRSVVLREPKNEVNRNQKANNNGDY